MEKQIIEVNKKVAGKYEKVGEVAIFVPTLEDAGFTAERQMDKEGKPVVEDGLPVYVEDKHNWVQGAMLAAVKAQARNKLVPGSATLKDGASIAEDWDALTAEGERGGNGAALAAVRELKAAFVAWVATLGKSATTQQVLTTLFGNRQALSLQSPSHKEKMEAYVTDFAATLDADALAKGERYLQSLIDACKAETEAEDF
jgi:hypothetical protein